MEINNKYNLNMVNVCLRFADKSSIENIRCVNNRFDDHFFNEEFNNDETGLELMAL